MAIGSIKYFSSRSTIQDCIPHSPVTLGGAEGHGVRDSVDNRKRFRNGVWSIRNYVHRKYGSFFYNLAKSVKHN